MSLKNHFRGLPDLKLNQDIESVEFPETQYFQEATKKTQIVLHHSAGWDNARGMFAGWKADKQRVATCIGIVDSGKIYQAFSSKYWAWHVNITSGGNAKIKNDPKFGKWLNSANATGVEKRTIGIEICNWGQLVQINGQFHTWASSLVNSNPAFTKPITVDESKICYYPDGFRGYKYYEKYTTEELDACYKLLKYWGAIYNIPLKYHPDIWEVNEDALKGTPGIYAHVSYRIDKFDVHPQPELIEMLSAL